MPEPNYFDRDRDDLPPLVRVNPNRPDPEPSASGDAVAQRQRAIFAALAQVLTPMGVKFEFAIKQVARPPVAVGNSETTALQSLDRSHPALEYRLWVRCHSPKSLDCQLLAEPLARALRQIGLSGFQDAIVQFSRLSLRDTLLAGKRLGDWRLRVDLTPKLAKLEHWARWGDVQAISRLLDLALHQEGVRVHTMLASLTLQIYCALAEPQARKFPVKKNVVDAIAPRLIAIGPQGIQGATVRGMVAGDESAPPMWVHWLDLPALGDPQYSPPPIVLAGRGDEAALIFVLERLLNPDLDRWCELGGTNVSLLYRQGLLHIMSEAPLCPIQSQVASVTIKVLKQLNLPGVRGARVHGRIAGQAVAKWTAGEDFVPELLELPAAGATAPAPKLEPAPIRIAWDERLRAQLLKTGIWKQQIDKAPDRLAFHPRFRWQSSLLLLLVGLGAIALGDMAMRLKLNSQTASTSNSQAAAQLSFNNPLLEQKLAQYQLRCVKERVPDVLIVGSSRAMRGIDPQILAERLGASGRAIESYNFGINGATAQVVDTILRQLLSAQQLPKLVIWADGARAFNSGRADRTYETIVQSQRYRQLALRSGLQAGGLEQIHTTIRNTYQAIDSSVDRQFAQISAAYNQRQRLERWLQAQVPDLPALATTDDNTEGASVTDRDIDNHGFLALDVRFDPATYFQKYAKVTGESDGDYTNFQLGGHQDRALSQTLALLAERKIPLVFVNMPLTDIYSDKFRSEREVRFQQYMQARMTDSRSLFIDLSQLLARDYDRFSDPSHLNQSGAIEVSRYLADSIEIPWPQPSAHDSSLDRKSGTPSLRK